MQDFFGQTTNYETTKIKNKLKKTSAEVLRDKFVDGDKEAIAFFEELLRDLDNIDEEVSEYFVYANSQVEKANERFVVRRTAIETEEGTIVFFDNLIGRVRGNISFQDIEEVNRKKPDKTNTYYLTNRYIAQEIAWSDTEFLEKLKKIDSLLYYHAQLKYRDDEQELLDYLPFVIYEDGDLYFETPPKTKSENKYNFDE